MQTLTETVQQQNQTSVETTKKDYEVAVDTFLQAEKAWQEMEDYVANGKFLPDLLTNANGDPAKALVEWQNIWNFLRTKQEDYNTKRKTAADTLRAAVTSPNQPRGPEGDATMLSYGGFKVSSVTKRNFDSAELFDHLKKRKLISSLLALRTLDKNGKEVPVVKQEWDIDYDSVLVWLRQNKLDEVVRAAYTEKESTPQVRGAKEIYFLGEKKKD